MKTVHSGSAGFGGGTGFGVTMHAQSDAPHAQGLVCRVPGAHAHFGASPTLTSGWG